MPPLRDRTLIAKILRKYRLEIARAILCNESNISLVLSDIRRAYETAELCDAYAIKTLISWLGTKYGFTAYMPAIKSDPHAVLTYLDRCPAFVDEYPFAHCHISNLASVLPSQALEILESGLEADLYLLGSLYEQIVDRPLVIDQLGRPYIRKERARCLSGQFYTPPWIVKYCFERVFTEDLSGLITSTAW